MAVTEECCEDCLSETCSVVSWGERSEHKDLSMEELRQFYVGQVICPCGKKRFRAADMEDKST